MANRRRLVDAQPTTKTRRGSPRRVFLCSVVDLGAGLPGNRSPDRPESTLFIPSSTVSTSAAPRCQASRCHRFDVGCAPMSGVPMSPDRHQASRCQASRCHRTDIRRPDVRRPDVTGPTSGVPTSGVPMSPDRHQASRCQASRCRPGPPEYRVIPPPSHDMGGRPRRAGPWADQRVLGPCFSQIFP